MKCSKCGTEMTALDSFRCANCGKMVCLRHRMSENHDCYVGDPLGGVEVKSLFDAKSAPKQINAPVVAETREFQHNQPVQEKKKRFGLF